MPVDLTQIDKRLARAKAQIETLDSYVAAFRRNLKRNGVVVEVEDDGLKHVARVYFTWTVPDEWGLMLGEIFHHMRSSLDNFAWQLVIANGGTPDDSTEFPIATKPGWYESVVGKKLRGVPPDALAQIKRLQPISRTDGQAPAEHWLAVIHAIDIRDKHKVVHVMAAVPETVGYEIRPEDVGCVARSHFGALESSAPIMTFIFASPQPQKVKVDESVTLQVAVAETETTPFIFLNPGELMNGWWMVRRTIDRIAAVTP